MCKTVQEIHCNYYDPMQRSAAARPEIPSCAVCLSAFAKTAIRLTCATAISLVPSVKMFKIMKKEW